MHDQIKSISYQDNNIINGMTLFVYKSSRTNSKSEMLNVFHLISENKKIQDDRIISQFVGTLESVVYHSMKYGGHIEITAYVSQAKKEAFINSNDDLYCGSKDIHFNFQRVKFSSIEQCIIFLFSLYCLIYPYNEISLSNEIYSDPSVKYLINKFYHGTNN